MRRCTRLGLKISIAQEYNISEFLEKILKETEAISVENPRRISEVISGEILKVSE